MGNIILLHPSKLPHVTEEIKIHLMVLCLIGTPTSSSSAQKVWIFNCYPEFTVDFEEVCE